MTEDWKKQPHNHDCFGCKPPESVDDIDRALIKAMPMLKSQQRDTVMWTWLRGAYEAGKLNR